MKFLRKIKKMIDWFPIIWKSEDYDYRHAIDIFAYQLKRTSDYLSSDNSYTVNAKLHANKINLALKLMKKVYDGGYYEEYEKEVEDLYGKYHYSFEDSDDFLKRIWEYPYTKEQLEMIDKDMMRRLMQKMALQEKAHRVLWKFIERNIKNWWD